MGFHLAVLVGKFSLRVAMYTYWIGKDILKRSEHNALTLIVFCCNRALCYDARRLDIVRGFQSLRAAKATSRPFFVLNGKVAGTTGIDGGKLREKSMGLRWVLSVFVLFPSRAVALTFSQSAPSVVNLSRDGRVGSSGFQAIRGNIFFI